MPALVFPPPLRNYACPCVPSTTAQLYLPLCPSIAAQFHGFVEKYILYKCNRDFLIKK